MFNVFLRLKVCLVQQDSKAAADQIKAMLACEDFTQEILRVGLDCAWCTSGCVSLANDGLLQMCKVRRTQILLLKLHGLQRETLPGEATMYNCRYTDFDLICLAYMLLYTQGLPSYAFIHAHSFIKDAIMAEQPSWWTVGFSCFQLFQFSSGALNHLSPTR